MSKVTDCVKKEILYRDFIYSEIIKRYVEGFDIDCLNEVMEIRSVLCKDIPDGEKDKFFLVVIGQLLCMLDPIINKVTWVFSNHLDFLNKYIDVANIHKEAIRNQYEENIINLYKRLIDISIKYDIIATELLYPIDMIDIIDNYNKNFYPPTAYRFRNEINNKFRIIKFEDDLIVYPLKIALDEKDIDYLKIQFIIDRIVSEKNITTDDIEFYYKIEKHGDKKNDKTQSRTFFRHILGLLSWDADIYIDSKIDISQIYWKYQNKNMKCNGESCYGNNLETCSCSRVETCQRFQREARRLMRLCIQKRKILPSNEKGESEKPSHTSVLKRYPLSFFH
ncbi:MAG: hypothetical protein E7022_07920 [Desulfovibrio desulfuricans]|nr:hypothetical protein [Desulfovibrio desulfuricans]